MPKPLTTTTDYRELLADIRKEMEHGLKKVEELLERQKVLSCWAIGRKISVYLNIYLVDVFYLPKEKDLRRIAAEGLWLNGRMVEAGIAKVWKR